MIGGQSRLEYSGHRGARRTWTRPAGLLRTKGVPAETAAKEAKSVVKASVVENIVGELVVDCAKRRWATVLGRSDGALVAGACSARCGYSLRRSVTVSRRAGGRALNDSRGDKKREQQGR